MHNNTSQSLGQLLLGGPRMSRSTKWTLVRLFYYTEWTRLTNKQKFMARVALGGGQRYMIAI
ncbi:ABC transporter ATP-binding protein [Sesbania bispinosa]|nr:ABC transporter ATP-binding protein [Sesbania bispinosa]